MTEFESEEKLREFGADLFAGVPLDRKLVGDFLISWDGVRKIPRGEPPGDKFRSVVPRYRWVIRDDDLNVIGVFSDALRAAAAVGFFAVAIDFSQAATVATGVLLTGARLVRQTLKKGASLEQLPFRVLLVLRANAPQGLTPEELLEILQRVSATTMAEVEGALASLAGTSVGDGTVLSFASRDGAGRWHCSGV
jgi:hypothetical protein